MGRKLENKVALVTGGNGSLGKGIVKALLNEGAKVIFCGRNEEKNQNVVHEMNQLGYDVLALKCDISNSSDVKQMYKTITQHYGTLDILVNNAAVTSGNGLHKGNGKTDRENYIQLTSELGTKFSLEVTKNMTDEEWESSMKINLNGVFFCTREALKIMEHNKKGKIINIVSMAGVSNKSPHSPSYAAAKGGVVAFTKNLAVEVAGAGVIVNAIAPGFIETPAFNDFINSVRPEVIQGMLLDVPLKRLGTIEENAALVVYLASDEANYIVGQVINTNGGMF